MRGEEDNHVSLKRAFGTTLGGESHRGIAKVVEYVAVIVVAGVQLRVVY